MIKTLFFLSFLKRDERFFKLINDISILGNGQKEGSTGREWQKKSSYTPDIKPSGISHIS